MLVSAALMIGDSLARKKTLSLNFCMGGGKKKGNKVYSFLNAKTSRVIFPSEKDMRVL